MWQSIFQMKQLILAFIVGWLNGLVYAGLFNSKEKDTQLKSKKKCTLKCQKIIIFSVC